MANSNQGKRIGAGAQNLAPGTEKKTEQTLQSVLQQQLDKSVASDTNNNLNNSRSGLFIQLRQYLDTLIQKISNSNESALRTEKIITALSKKIDSALSKIEQQNKKTTQNNTEGSTKKLIEIFTKNFTKDDIQRIIASTDSINTKITALIQKNNEESVNTTTKNQQTETAVLAYLKENETTNKQFVEKFNTSVTEFKNFISSIQTVSREANQNTIASVNDIKSILTQFQVSINAINNKLNESKSGHIQNFSESSEKVVNTTEGLIKTINDTNESAININSRFYKKIENFLQDFQKNNKDKKEELKVLKETKIIEKQVTSIPKQQKQSILSDNRNEQSAMLASILNADFKKIRESLSEVTANAKKQNVVYINQNIPTKQNNPESRDQTDIKQITVHKNININSADEPTKKAQDIVSLNNSQQAETNNTPVITVVNANSVTDTNDTKHVKKAADLSADTSLLKDNVITNNTITPKFISIADIPNRKNSNIALLKIKQDIQPPVSTEFMRRYKSSEQFRL